MTDGTVVEFAQRESLGLAEQDFTAALFHYTATLPGGQQPTGSERCHVCGIGQFLVADIEFDATGNLLPDRLGQTTEHTGQSFFSRVTGQRDMRGKVPG